MQLAIKAEENMQEMCDLMIPPSVTKGKFRVTDKVLEMLKPKKC